MPYRAAILTAIEDLKDHQTGSPASAIRRRIKDHDTVFSAAVANSDDDTAWNETLFQSTLKSLVSNDVLAHINGTNYKFTDKYLQKRAKGMRERAESMEEHRHEAALMHAREEPTKEAPRKKTVHAKVKMNERPVITVVNPEGKRRTDDEMDTDEEDAVKMDRSEHKKHVKIIPRKVEAKKMILD